MAREVVQCECFFNPPCELFGFLEIPNMGQIVFCLVTLGDIYQNHLRRINSTTHRHSEQIQHRRLVSVSYVTRNYNQLADHAELIVVCSFNNTLCRCVSIVYLSYAVEDSSLFHAVMSDKIFGMRVWLIVVFLLRVLVDDKTA
jgi:hypothetical protein